MCNGSTADSDSVCEGSNPSPAAKTKARPFGLAFVFCMHRRIRTLTLSSPSGCRVSGERVGTSRFASNGGTPFESFSRCQKALSFGWELFFFQDFGRKGFEPSQCHSRAVAVLTASEWRHPGSLDIKRDPRHSARISFLLQCCAYFFEGLKILLRMEESPARGALCSSCAYCA